MRGAVTNTKAHKKCSLDDAFSLQTRCAFGGWIKDNRWRVDFLCRTFVSWRDQRLYFFVPIIG